MEIFQNKVKKIQRKINSTKFFNLSENARNFNNIISISLVGFGLFILLLAKNGVFPIKSIWCAIGCTTAIVGSCLAKYGHNLFICIIYDLTKNKRSKN